MIGGHSQQAGFSKRDGEGGELKPIPGRTPGYARSRDTSLNTLPHVDQPSTGTAKGWKSDRRRQTLLSLLDELEQLKDEMDGGYGADCKLERETNVQNGATINAHFQTEGAQIFFLFDHRLRALDHELQNFINAVRQLGSSVGLLSSACRLRERLERIIHLFRDNAVELFPNHVKKHGSEALKPSINYRGEIAADRASKYHRLPTSSNPEALPEELDLLAKDLNTFLDHLNEIPEFTEEVVNASALVFQGNLKYRASCLREYSGQFCYPAVRRYVNDLSVEMGEDMECITRALVGFIETGVPTIRFAQSHASEVLQNLSTMAIYFSAVSSSTLGYSWQYDVPAHIAVMKDMVNILWLMSLVFAIASAVNSMLSLHWRNSVYRSPRNCVPWWVLIWITRTPLWFLAVSVFAYSAGLVCFAFSNYANPWIPWSTTFVTIVTAVPPLAVGTWFASERWAFTKTRGETWLAGLLPEMSHRALIVTSIGWSKRVLTTHTRAMVAWGRIALAWTKGRVTIFRNRESKYATPTRCHSNGHSTVPKVNMSPQHSYNLPVLPLTTLSPEAAASVRFGWTSGLFRIASGLSSRTSTTEEDKTTKSAIIELGHGSGTTEGAARRRFAEIGWRVVRMLRGIPQIRPGALSRPASPTSSEWEPRSPQSICRLKHATSVLKQLAPTQDLGVGHSALVRHLQFSPNGDFLATSSWDRTTLIWKVGQPFVKRCVLAHPEGFVGQVAWSPDGSLLLCKFGRAIKIWTTSGVLVADIDRRAAIRSTAWLPDGKSLISVEGFRIRVLDLTGKVLASHSLARLHIRDIAVTPDGQRILAVVTLEETETGLTAPIKSRAEKRIIVYNMAEQVIESQIPTLQEVCKITMSATGQCALISFENQAPAQLWKVNIIRNQARLMLAHNYMLKAAVASSGPSYFGGQSDQFVICSSKGGNVLVWDRETATLLHSVHAQSHGSDLTDISWNCSSATTMFAAATLDGTVRIWAAPPHKRIATSILAASASACGTPISRAELSASEDGDQLAND
ncbi:hypothetical protein BOTBODRAFT_535641 [Botryobasidium botryosum FD-172 SS1]|uniref:Anaphase-promoting complex subunit 4 WD40 domain-containing protein n=1 Tax=Botryobasidium botryosum (strain FD-172 SS1) TaxID=930990 RepID=A0A067MB39_BOTB1|nr:hypothetical protein BOTBODRAFT_535641 [Botryobasidium botryosum FD-172 SS1]